MKFVFQNLIRNSSSMRSRLIVAFIATSVFPIIILNLFSYYNSAQIVNENTQELTKTNLEQMDTSLNVWLDSYEDILYQLYTDDELVELAYKMNQEEDLAVTVNQMRRKLRTVLTSKEYIRSIAVLTANGQVVNCDQLTAVTMENSWTDNYSISQEDIYEKTSADNAYHIFPTEYASTFANNDYYMFHLGHRIINYKKLDERIGVIIVSLDEKMLREICTSQTDSDAAEETLNNFYFLVDDRGVIVSYVDPTQIGQKIMRQDALDAEKIKNCQQFVSRQNTITGSNTVVYIKHNDSFNWDIVNVSNQNKTMEKLSAQQNLLVIVALLCIVIVVATILVLTTQLTASLKKLMLTMEKAGGGELVARVEIGKDMPIEVENIAIRFNIMLEKLEHSIEKEKEAAKRQRNAEITALESQINPHFLYNILDTINWMAIDKDDFEISNAISSLATILRYAIDNSNGIVTLREETDWLKKYIFLQQTRLKNAFQCDIHVAAELLDEKIHKLLLQPFVENAILHGFDSTNHAHQLSLDIINDEAYMVITLTDNGKGMEKELVEHINQHIFPEDDKKGHIGMKNAITRLEMYYGEAADYVVRSELGKGTTIIIRIRKGVLADENSDCRR